MTTISPPENGFMRKVSQGSKEDDIFYMYGSTAAHIKEETEYVRTIRATLEKIQSQLFKDDLSNKSSQEKNSHTKQNGYSNEDAESFSSRYKRIVEKLKDQDLQILDVHRDNEDLQIKLEATREAGASAIRDATRKLYENYNKKSEQARKCHEEEKQILQVSAEEHQDRLMKSIEKLNDVADKIQEKHSRILELEKLMGRMEAENASLVEKKRLLENEISRRMSDPSNRNGCSAIQAEVLTVEEQINHLQQLMMSQHQHLRALIQESEDLKNHLKEQDVTIDELKEKVDLLECQNKELKYKVEHWSSPSTFKVTKATSVNESMLRTMSPYFMLLKQKNSPGSS
ncbi:coiled-coil domain-containing protein 68 isoform X2 [Engystomops pustulosus]